MRGYETDGVIDAIRAAGGELYAITSEPQSLATAARADWETGLEHVGDPHQEIMGQCRDKGWLSLFTSAWGDGAPGGSSDFLASDTSWMSHPKGYYQPGVLALNGAGRVLYRWRSRPTRQNIGGAVARPTAPHVWTRVQAAVAEPADAPDVPYDEGPALDASSAPWLLVWPFFVAMLVANGWFIKPAAFGHQPGNQDAVARRQRNALIRLPLFVAAWAAAFAILPVWLVALVLAGWVAMIVPRVREVTRLIQNVGPNEEPG